MLPSKKSNLSESKRNFVVSSNKRRGNVHGQYIETKAKESYVKINIIMLL